MEEKKTNLNENLNEVKEETKVKKENSKPEEVKDEPKEKDNRTFGEKLEDTLDAAREKTEDFFYGEKGDFTDDIPATMYDSRGYRRVNKVQTRKNINKRIFAHKGFIKGILIVLGIGILMTIFYSIINALLLS